MKLRELKPQSRISTVLCLLMLFLLKEIQEIINRLQSMALTQKKKNMLAREESKKIKLSGKLCFFISQIVLIK